MIVNPIYTDIIKKTFEETKPNEIIKYATGHCLRTLLIKHQRFLEGSDISTLYAGTLSPLMAHNIIHSQPYNSLQEFLDIHLPGIDAEKHVCCANLSNFIIHLLPLIEHSNQLFQVLKLLYNQNNKIPLSCILIYKTFALYLSGLIVLNPNVIWSLSSKYILMDTFILLSHFF